jgi:hypothetical protein
MAEFLPEAGSPSKVLRRDRIALEVALADSAGEKRGWRLPGCQVETAEHSRVRWRSLHVSDAEDTSEAVCYDASL